MEDPTATAPSVAVIIPCWNLGETVEATVASVVAQTLPASEIVVVDDGSDAPETLAALRRLEAGPARIARVAHGGVAGARAEGVRRTSSPLLVLLDADDLLAPDFLARTSARIAQGIPVDYVATAYELFGEVQATFTPPAPDQPVRHLCEGSYCITALLRRSLWEEIGGCDPALAAAEDWDFWLSVLERKTPGALIDAPLVRYRIRAGSRDRRGLVRERHLEAVRAIVAKHRAFINGLGAQVLEASARSVGALRDEEQRLRNLRREALDELIQIDAQTGPAPVHVRRTALAGAVLCYHRVAAHQPDRFGLCTPAARFRSHLEGLVQRYHPISLTDMLDAIDARDLPERAVAVTLDDGYLDAFEASKVLSALGVPATFYVNTDRLDEPHEAWQEVLERIFLSDESIPPAFKITFGDAPLMIPCLGTAARHAAFDTLYQLGRGASALGRRALAAQVSEWSGLALSPRDSHRLLTGPEIVELAARPGHEIGSHSANHLLLPVHPAVVQRHEVESGRADLERLLLRPVRAFAYPYGETTPTTVEAARLAGFQSAVSTRSGLVRPWSDPMEIPRIEVGAWDVSELSRRLDALFARRDAE